MLAGGAGLGVEVETKHGCQAQGLAIVHTPKTIAPLMDGRSHFLFEVLSHEAALRRVGALVLAVIEAIPLTSPAFLMSFWASLPDRPISLPPRPISPAMTPFHCPICC